MAKNTLLVVDGNWYIHRAFHAMFLGDRQGKNIERRMCQSFLSMVLKDADAIQATHLAVAFDGDRSFRYKIFPQYKANRTADKDIPHLVQSGIAFPEEQLNEFSTDPYTYLESVMMTLVCSGIRVIQLRRYESDDVMASVSHQLGSASCLVVLATHDKDIAQCVNENVRLFWPGNKKKQHRVLGIKDVVEFYGVEPNQIVDYLRLIGDSVDNIPGASGVGPDTARKIIKEYGTLEKAFKTKDKKLRSKLRRSSSNLEISGKLIPLCNTCVKKPRIQDYVQRDPDVKALKALITNIPENITVTQARLKMSRITGLFD
jgi:DNA polymerase-1